MPKARTDSELAGAIGRQIAALGRRLALDDPEPSYRLLAELRGAVESALAVAVAGWREHSFSDGEIGEALGVTKQAVQQRWPRG